MAEKSAAVKKIESLKEEIKKQTEAVKTQLARELSAACDTFKILTDDLGQTNIFKDPQFREYVDVLNIQMDSGGSSSGTHQRAGHGQLKTFIVEILGSGHAMGHKDIKDNLSKKLGKPASNQYNLLDKLEKQKVIVSSGTGKAKTYKLPK